MHHDTTLPIKIDSTSNGEFAPVPLSRAAIFGLNAAPVYGVDPSARSAGNEPDPVERLKAAYLADPQPSFATYGPRNAAEWQRMRRLRLSPA